MIWSPDFTSMAPISVQHWGNDERGPLVEVGARGGRPLRNVVRGQWCNKYLMKVFKSLANLCNVKSILNTAHIIMVARSSDSESEATIIFYRCFFFFLATLSQTSENRHPRNFPTRRGLVFNRTFAIAISSKCPLKRTGPKNPKFVQFFVPSRRQLAP